MPSADRDIYVPNVTSSINGSVLPLSLNPLSRTLLSFSPSLLTSLFLLSGSPLGSRLPLLGLKGLQENGGSVSSFQRILPRFIWMLDGRRETTPCCSDQRTSAFALRRMWVLLFGLWAKMVACRWIVSVYDATRHGICPTMVLHVVLFTT